MRIPCKLMPRSTAIRPIRYAFLNCIRTNKWILLTIFVAAFFCFAVLRGVDFGGSNTAFSGARKFAYVFYVTSSDYTCYALINVHRLIYDLHSNPEIDIVIFATQFSHIDSLCPIMACPFPEGRVKIRWVSPEMEKIGESLTDNMYYMDSYVRFEAFKLYDEYDRIIIMDADGLLLRNVDHLFQMDLGPFDAAAAFAHYINHQWISSVLLVVKPSKKLYRKLMMLLTPDKLKAVSAEAEGARFDMDILNYIFERGNLTKRLTKYYALLDSYFFEDEASIERRRDELNLTYFVHFTRWKPLEYLETRPWPLEVNSTVTMPKSRGFVEMVYYPFWTAFDQHCRFLVRKMPTVAPGNTEFGVIYPDPAEMIEFINNSSELMIVHL